MRTRLITILLSAGLLFQLSQFARPQAAPVAITGSTVSQAAAIPAPADVLGFVPGDDRKLASWQQVVAYFTALDLASERVKFETLGQSTMGKPFVMATISSPENLARLAEYQSIQEQLADPRKLGAPAGRDRKAAELIKRGKTIVLITCGIHSTEVGSYLSSMLIAHRLAAASDPEIQKILRDTIVLLVPSLNPDGVDIVKDWYDQTLGTPYEGTDPPELYNKYVGHDDNRDWYAFTQVETQIAVDKIHNVWHPQIVHDIHQQGEYGARFFLPPYLPPVEPNVPKQIVAGYTELGNFMAREMRAKGLPGITTDSTYDAWSPSRAYSHYHGGVRILSETASCKIATPITVSFEQLRKEETGYDPRIESANFRPVWRGGEWHLRDITNYMTTAAFLLLDHAAQNREEWLSRFYEIGRAAVRARGSRELKGFVIPVASRSGINVEASNQSKLLSILERAGVEVNRLASSFRLGKEEFPMLSGVIHLNQPYGGFAQALLTNQPYPNLRDPQGHPISPYDVTAHNLAELMGVRIVPFYRPLSYQRRQAHPTIFGSFGDQDYHTAIYRSAAPAMDEGWTRWVLAASQIRFKTIADREIRERTINELATIIIPDQQPEKLLKGHPPGTMPQAYTGGLGQTGVQALREFVEQGGTLVCLNRASSFAIEQFKLPVRNVVANLSEKEFFVPGSILRIELDTTSSLARGMPKETIAWVENSPVFEVVESGGTGHAMSETADKMSALPATALPASALPASSVRVIARYPADRNPLLSGWLLGADRIKGKAALVEVTLGKGRIILFGFRPQYRGQSLATYPLLFNAISGR